MTGTAERYVEVEWDTDGEVIEDLPGIVAIPIDVSDEDLADWLSTQYDWCVLGWAEVNLPTPEQAQAMAVALGRVRGALADVGRRAAELAAAWTPVMEWVWKQVRWEQHRIALYDRTMARLRAADEREHRELRRPR